MSPQDLTFDWFVSHANGHATKLQRVLVTLLATITMMALAGVGVAMANGGQNAAGDNCQKWEVGEGNEGGWEAEEDDPENPLGVTIFFTDTRDGEFDFIGFDWTSTELVGSIRIKGGNDNGQGAIGYDITIVVDPAATSGSVNVAEALGLEADAKVAGLSFITFCEGSPPPPDVFDQDVTLDATCVDETYVATLTMENEDTSTGDITFDWWVETGDASGSSTLSPDSSDTESFNVPTDGLIVYVDIDGDQQADYTLSVSWQDCSEPDPEPTPTETETTGGGGGTTPSEPEPEVESVVLVNNPAASASFSCDDGGVVVLDNTDSDGAVTFTVSVDDSTIDIEVAAGQTRSLLFDIEEDTTSTVTVTAEGDTLVDAQELTADCAAVLGIVEINEPTPEPAPDPEPAPEVLPAVEEAPAPETLPATGVSSITLALLGGGAALAGAMMLLADDRRRRPGSLAG